MTDREKVIADLKLSKASTVDGYSAHHYGGEIHGITTETLCDALTLLKAQEPRVISWQDAESMHLCWVETRRPHTISPADLIHYFDESPNITVFKIHQDAKDWPLDEYGIKWRCWDNEPTNEQMEATPWN